MYPQLAKMVKLARDLGLWVMLNTNAVLLTQKKSRELLEAGLTDIFFSFDSPYPQTYEKIRVGAQFSKTLENIRTFMHLKDLMGLKYVQTRASMVLPEDPVGREKIKEDYLKLFRDLKVAEIGFGLPTILERDYSSLTEGLLFICPDLFRRTFIFHDGIVGPCCGDWERRLVMGDAKREPIATIWQGENYVSLRSSHVNGDFRKVPACRACSVPYLAQTSY
jgi:hypothetical protein